MLDFVVNLIDETAPVMQFSQALVLKVRRLGNGLQQHGIQVEGIFRAMKRNKALGSIILCNERVEKAAQ